MDTGKNVTILQDTADAKNGTKKGAIQYILNASFMPVVIWHNLRTADQIANCSTKK